MDFEILEQAITKVSELISEENYYNRLALKLADPSISSKIYWSILKTLYNNKKMPLIPLLLIDNELGLDFKNKAIPFNNFFPSKYSPINNDSTLLMLVNFNTTTSLNEINFNEEDLLKIIQGLDSDSNKNIRHSNQWNPDHNI